MLRIINVDLTERAVVFADGLPREALAPGRHWLWGFGRTVRTFNTDALVLRVAPEIRAALPTGWFDEITVEHNQRAILYRDGVPRVFLRPGVHRYWTVDPSVHLCVLSLDEPVPELSDELMAVLPPDEYVDVLVHAHQKALCYVQGRLTEVLEPGRYVLWQHASKQVQVACVDLRRAELTIAGQELMTRDKVTLRLSLALDYAIVDPVLATQAVTSVRDALYLHVQLWARGYVASVVLDQLLEGRDEMTRYLEEHMRPVASAFGVRVDGVGVKDVVLPGDMKILLNRVIEAEKEAAANVILRREETAATRSLANTAKVIADNPVLMRLKELESIKEIASQIGEVRLVVGSDGLDKLAMAGLLGTKNDGR